MRGAALAGLVLFIAACHRAPRDQVIEGPPQADAVHAEWQKILPPRASLGDNALRVVIEPSFGDFLYAVDYAPQRRNCITPHGGTVDELKPVEHRFCGHTLVTYRILAQREQPPEPRLRQWTFQLPQEEWRFFIEGLDKRLDRWRGAPCCMMDGTGTTIERTRDGKLRSVSSNAAEYREEVVGNPAYFAQTETLRFLFMFGPSGMAPRSTN